MQDFRNGTTALIQASLFGNTYSAMLLLDSGADPNLSDNGGTSALMTAAMLGQTDYAKLLMASGADINLKSADGSNALFLAAMNGHTDIVKTLLERGARPDSLDTDGTRALVITARDDIADSISIKLYRGYNKDFSFSENLTAMVATRDDGVLEAVNIADREGSLDDVIANSDRATAFIKAFRSGQVAVVKVFLKKNARIDPQKTAKYTDLMVASMNGHTDIVKMLLDRGANPGLKDNSGKTAIDYAKSTELRNLLEANLKKVNIHQ
jgi:ankyrin repeat protein